MCGDITVIMNYKHQIVPLSRKLTDRLQTSMLYRAQGDTAVLLVGKCVYIVIAKLLPGMPDRIRQLIAAVMYIIHVWYSTPDQCKSGSACHKTRSANHRCRSVVI